MKSDKMLRCLVCGVSLKSTNIYRHTASKTRKENTEKQINLMKHD
jgi:hypothetical protein